jgi:hypothetical protein
MAALKQNTDGSVSIMRETDGQELFRAGGPLAVGATAPAFLPGSTLKLPIAGPTDTAGALLAWQNNLGYDIVVYDPAGPAEAGPGVQPTAATAADTTPAAATIAPIDGADDCPAPVRGMHSIDPDGIARAKPR